jgi:GNAT superfamily N-acetyltransferase
MVHVRRLTPDDAPVLREPEWLVFSMWVAPQARGRGLAADLVDAGREAAEKGDVTGCGLR